MKQQPNSTNAIGERISTVNTLWSNRKQKKLWTKFVGDERVTGVWQALNIWDVKGKDVKGWRNLVAHNMFVGAVSGEIASHMPVEVEVSEQYVGMGGLRRAVEVAGLLHDAAQRYNMDRRRSRQQEVVTEEGDPVGKIMADHNIPDWIVQAGRNTGRLPDRYLSGADRDEAIRARTLEENIVGYADARTMDSGIITLEEARAEYARRKKDDASQAFFAPHGPWISYYGAVENYLVEQSGGSFQPLSLTNEAILNSVKTQVRSR